jgi:glycosidase
VSTARTSDLWWKNAVIYCLDVETFLDWDGDGIGDIRGLTERIDYLAGIGVSCIWLMPFQPSPNRDDGYDITDFYGVDPRLGTLGDFVMLIRTAKDRGMRVIVDLVVNHTSDQHPWFRDARASPDSRFRDFYVWRDRPTRTPKASVVFPDAEDSIWAWDDRGGSGTCITSTPTSRTSTSAIGWYATRSPRSPGSGWSSASTASASMPCRSSSTRARSGTSTSIPTRS